MAGQPVYRDHLNPIVYGISMATLFALQKVASQRANLIKRISMVEYEEFLWAFADVAKIHPVQPFVNLCKRGRL